MQTLEILIEVRQGACEQILQLNCFQIFVVLYYKLVFKFLVKIIQKI